MKFLAVTTLFASAFLGQLSAGTTATTTPAEQPKQDQMQQDPMQQDDNAKAADAQPAKFILIADMQQQGACDNNAMDQAAPNADQNAQDPNQNQMTKMFLIGTSPSKPAQQDDAQKADAMKKKEMDDQAQQEPQATLLMV